MYHQYVSGIFREFWFHGLLVFRILTLTFLVSWVSSVVLPNLIRPNMFGGQPTLILGHIISLDTTTASCFTTFWLYVTQVSCASAHLHYQYCLHDALRVLTPTSLQSDCEIVIPLQRVIEDIMCPSLEPLHSSPTN